MNAPIRHSTNPATPAIKQPRWNRSQPSSVRFATAIRRKRKRGKRKLLLQAAALILRYVVDHSVLAQLQGADVGGNRPTVGSGNLRSVARHGAKALGHDANEVSGRLLPDNVGMIGLRAAIAALNYHAIAADGVIVERRTINVE